ncbi:MAG: hypothetical protein OEL75_02440 [Kiritimatiellaceae bacterium]|nr:hypothetical protein [Kiritimatiellaceae bacterium]
MTLQQVDENKATFDLKIYDRIPNGVFRYTVSPATETQTAITASLPKFKGLSLNTTTTLELGSWSSMGELIKEQQTSSGKAIKARIGTWVRILPPKGVPFKSAPTFRKVLASTSVGTGEEEILNK